MNPDLFSARRLTTARQRRGLTQRELAEKLEVTPKMVSLYEDGRNRPSAAVLERMPFVLRFPPSFFLSDDLETIEPEAITFPPTEADPATPKSIKPEAVSFRARRSLTARTRDRMIASGQIAAEIIAPAFRRRFRLPELAIPDLSDEEPERAACMLREVWGLGGAPVSNVVHLLESKGVQVFWTTDPSPCLDAVSFWREVYPFVVLNLGKDGDRGRFDAAHELGHLVLHRHLSQLGTKEVEEPANRFASAFHLPELAFRADCRGVLTISRFLQLKKKWKVSVQAMIRRCRDLGILTQWQYERFCVEIGTLGFRTKEPGAPEREESRLQSLIYDRLAARGVSAQDFAGELGLLPEDLDELTPAVRLLRASAIDNRNPQGQPTQTFLRVVNGGSS